MNITVPPIVVDDHGDIQIFRSVDEACLELEAIDVLHDTYEVFDSLGRALLVAVDGGEVTMDLDRRSPSQEEDLQGRLTRFVIRVGADRVGLSNPDAASLEVLLGALIRFQRT